MSATSTLGLGPAIWLTAAALSLLSACSSSVVSPIARDRLAKAESMFAERCLKSGEFIHRTVDNVEGIYLMKIRPNRINYGQNLEDQFTLDDPYGSDSGGDSYIKFFLRGSNQYGVVGSPAPGAPPRLGYVYVEALDIHDSKRYRYTGSVREYEVTSSILIGGSGKKFKTTGFVIDKIPAPGAAPRYGVTYDDISTREERTYWIAGSSLKVIDLQTNEVIAERIGYMMDRGQGNSSGGRAPWLAAANNACPGFHTRQGRPIPSGHGALAQLHQTLDFAEKVLRPQRTKGD